MLQQHTTDLCKVDDKVLFLMPSDALPVYELVVARSYMKSLRQVPLYVTCECFR